MQQATGRLTDKTITFLAIGRHPTISVHPLRYDTIIITNASHVNLHAIVQIL